MKNDSNARTIPAISRVTPERIVGTAATSSNYSADPSEGVEREVVNMKWSDYGNGIFRWDNYAGLDLLSKPMIADLQQISGEHAFFDFVIRNNGGYVSRDEFLCWFHSTWRYIPRNMLYETYKDLFDDSDWARGRWAYRYFFEHDLYSEVMSLNKHDTVNNPELKSLLDDDGYLTVYHGHYKKTMHNSNSWMLNKDNAIKQGRIYAGVYKSPSFYCVTGKVKLEDVITFISGHRTHEIVVMQKNVRNKVKECFNTKDIEFSF